MLSSFKSTWESSIILTGDANFDTTSCSAARDIYEQMLLNTYELPCHVIEPNVKIKGKKFIDHISTNINKIKKHKNTPFRHLTICNQMLLWYQWPIRHTKQIDFNCNRQTRTISSKKFYQNTSSLDERYWN